MSKNSIIDVTCLDLGAGNDPGEGGLEGGGRETGRARRGWGEGEGGNGEGEVEEWGGEGKVGKVDEKEWGGVGETGGGQ